MTTSSTVRGRPESRSPRMLRCQGMRTRTWELRPVIRTLIQLGGRRWPIELTLTARHDMGFRLLLGREALRGNYVVDPGRSFLCGRNIRIRRGHRPQRAAEA